MQYPTNAVAKRLAFLNGNKTRKVFISGYIALFLSILFTQSASATVYPQSVSTYENSFGFYGQTTKSLANGWVDISKYQTAFNTEKDLAKKYAPLLKVDPLLVLWWTYIETGAPGAKYDSYHYSYCGAANSVVKYHIDRNCENPNWGGWQLGYGEQFTDIREPGLLEAAFKATYGNPNDTTLVQSVGANVLSKSRIYKTFPKQTVAQLVANSNTYTRVDGNYWTYTLMRDPRISVYLLAQEIAWDVAGGRANGQNYRQVMASWGSYYSTNWQNFSNVLWDISTLWKLSDQGKWK
jgi:hypothetical protein